MNQNDQRGFTLIEILIVLAIIGILSVIGLVTLRDANQSARDARRIADLAQLRLGLELYQSDAGHYPVPVTGGGDGPDNSFSAPDGSIFSSATNPIVEEYLGRTVQDPVNSLSYHYVYDTDQDQNHKRFVLCFYKESVNYTSRYFTSEGEFLDAASCFSLP